MAERQAGARERAKPGPAVDPVAAFWLNMARHARTDRLRELHGHLALQRAEFVVYQRGRAGKPSA